MQHAGGDTWTLHLAKGWQLVPFVYADPFCLYSWAKHSWVNDHNNCCWHNPIGPLLTIWATKWWPMFQFTFILCGMLEVNACYSQARNKLAEQLIMNRLDVPASVPWAVVANSTTATLFMCARSGHMDREHGNQGTADTKKWMAYMILKYQGLVDHIFFASLYLNPDF